MDVKKTMMMKDEYNAGVSDGIDQGINLVIIEGRRKTILYILVEKAIAASSIDEFENEIDKL